MAVWRFSIFWSSVDNEGWSDNFFWEGADAVSAQAELDALINLVKALRCGDFKIDFARVSNVAIRGDSLVSGLTMPVLGTYAVPVNEYKLEANSAILIELFADTITKGHWSLRGLTTAQIKGRELQAETVFDTALASVQTRLQSGNYQVRSRLTIGPPPTYEYVPVVNAIVQRASARKPGRPFGVVRGRR